MRLRITTACLLLWLTGPVMAAAGGPDYELWTDLLMAHVRTGFVNYDGFAHDPRLPEFLAGLAAAPAAAATEPAARKALYLNAYNALAVRAVLDGYRTATRRQRKRFFTGLEFQVLGEATTLQDIEHGVLRPMGDPRIHFAIVCASLSCPRLGNDAFRPASVDSQLDAAARAFVNDPTRNRFDAGRRVAYVSPIFQWFDEDFSATAGSVQRWLSAYVADPAAAELLARDGFRLEYTDYDWGLNGHYAAAP